MKFFIVVIFAVILKVDSRSVRVNDIKSGEKLSIDKYDEKFFDASIKSASDKKKTDGSKVYERYMNDLSTPEKLTKAVFGHSRKARDASSSLKEFLKMETMKLEELKKNRTTDFATPKYMFPAVGYNGSSNVAFEVIIPSKEDTRLAEGFLGILQDLKQLIYSYICKHFHHPTAAMNTGDERRKTTKSNDEGSIVF